MLKREDDKIYISEDSGSYAVYFGREEKPDVIFSTECVVANDPDHPDVNKRQRGLWFILEWPEDCGPHVIDQFSSYKIMEVYQKAHDMALEKAIGHLHFSQLVAKWPITTPESRGPTRSPNHITLKKIIDNSRSVLNRNDSELVEYTKDPVSFVL